ncbi:hypothetical protein [Herbidospora daliensis]|uniref:hypothetical protein n=1 Tax=Herbidospora daliensis TaxID=295585 RepID=UPI0007832864|nr:hypothetical protein [Herbidospora daliensis]
MTVVNGYCTVDELREHLGDSGDKLSLTLLERAVNATSRAVEKYTHRRFWQDPTVQTRRYRPDDGALVRVHDISTLDDLVVETDPALDGSWSTTWGPSDFQPEPLDADADGGAYAWWKLRAIGDHRFPVSSGRPTLRVTARFGWSAIPDDVHEATLLRAAALFLRKDSPFGVAGMGSEGFAVRISRRDSDVCELLNGFVRAEMAGV